MKESHIRTFYVLSIVFGLVGIALIINLEIGSSKTNDPESSNLPPRAGYAFLLFVAGVLLEIAVFFSEAKTSVHITHRESVSSFKAEISTILEEKENQNKQSVVTDSRQDIGSPTLNRSEIECTKISEENREQVISRAEKGESLTTGVWNCLAQWEFYIRLIPIAWLTLSLVLFIQTAREELVNATLLPYTAITGLATGYLFHISIKPWTLYGLTRWIEVHRNEFTIPEYVTYVILLKNALYKPYLIFATTTAVFWTGYNLEGLVRTILTSTLIADSKISKIRERLSNSRKKKEKEISLDNISIASSPPKEKREPIPTLSKAFAFLTSLSGAILVGLSILLVQKSVSTLDQEATRNFGALWLVSLGSYAFTYPLGSYLGRFVPRRYHKNTLIAATYFLVPFANPDLTVPHYLLLMGAGLCGGIAYFISRTQYQRQLAGMRRQKQLLDSLLLNSKAKAFFQGVVSWSLGKDLILLKQQQRKRKMTWIIKGVLVLDVLYNLYFFFSFIAAQLSATVIVASLIPVLGGIAMYVGSFHILPLWTPSVYTYIPMSWMHEILHRDSFTFIFFLKIADILLAKGGILSAIDRKPRPSLALLNILLFNLLVTPVVIKAFFRRTEGYFPYIPRTKDIEQLISVFESKTFPEKDSQLTCSYQLLKFIQENYSELSITASPVVAVTLESQPESKNESNQETKSEVHQDSKSVNQDSNIHTGDALTEVSPISDSKEPSQAVIEDRVIDPQDPDLSFQNLIWRPLNSSPSNDLPEQSSSIPIAGLFAPNSIEPQLSLFAEFTSSYDQAYIRQRLNVAFFVRASDAAVRGPIVAGQFKLGLPKGLSLIPGVTSFRF